MNLPVDLGIGGLNESPCHNLTVLKHKELSKLQQEFTHLFYWGAYYDFKETVDIFLSMGINPFMKMFKGQGAFEAAIMGVKYDMLKYIIKDSKKLGKRYKCESNDALSKKYKA